VCGGACLYCTSDDRCEADGTCTPIPCDEGYACPAATHCDRTSLSADAHGCVRPTCSERGDCGEGEHCVLDRCWPTPGTCEEVVLVP
jgi:hypothetical protein